MPSRRRTICAKLGAVAGRGRAARRRSSSPMPACLRRRSSARSGRRSTRPACRPWCSAACTPTRPPTTSCRRWVARGRRRAGGRQPGGLVAVGGGSSIDAAKGIALAAVNAERGRALDYRNEFAVPGLPIVAIPTTAGTGAETNAFGVVTDPLTRRKFYVGHASTMPAAAILDPELHDRPAAGRHGGDRPGRAHPCDRVVPVGPGEPVGRRDRPAGDPDGRGHLARASLTAPTWRPGQQLLLASHMAGIGMAPPGSASCTPSGTRSAAATTSRTA